MHLRSREAQIRCLSEGRDMPTSAFWDAQLDARFFLLKNSDDVRVLIAPTPRQHLHVPLVYKVGQFHGKAQLSAKVCS